VTEALEAIEHLAQHARRITRGDIVGLFESQALLEQLGGQTVYPDDPLFDTLPKGADAIRVEYLHPYLRQGLEMYGYDPVAYCDALRESLS
jgi:hypothetical protein